MDIYGPAEQYLPQIGSAKTSQRPSFMSQTMSRYYSIIVRFESPCLYPDQFRQWKEAPATAQLPEGENLQQVWERTIPAWQRIVASTFEASASPKTVLAVAHNTVNKVILCHVYGKGLGHFWNFLQDNCALSVVDYPQGYGRCCRSPAGEHQHAYSRPKAEI